MRKKFLLDMIKNDNNASNIVRSSTKAVCGAFEREVIVKNSEVSKTKTKLKKAGYIIVGTGSAGFNRTKIWFNPAGVSL